MTFEQQLKLFAKLADLATDQLSDTVITVREVHRQVRRQRIQRGWAWTYRRERVGTAWWDQ